METLKPVTQGNLEVGKTYRAGVILHKVSELKDEKMVYMQWSQWPQWQVFQVFAEKGTGSGRWFRIDTPGKKAGKGSGWVSAHLLRNVIVREVTNV